jgi:hypothetical protein
MLSEALSALSADEVRAFMTTKSPRKKTKSQNSNQVHSFPVVFEVNLSAKPLLPIQIESNLPHIMIPIGQNPKSAIFALQSAYDTCAACNVGYLIFHLSIAEKFPQTVKSLTYCKDKYAPLILSGIVSEKKNDAAVMKPTASLPAIIEYWLPFPTMEGHRTTLKIALGKMVSVNTIIGMPMIGPAKLSLDLIDNVVDSGILDCEPFPVTFRPTSQSKPDFSKVNSDDTKLLATNTTTDHIRSEDAAACRVALANHDYNENTSEPVAKKAKIDITTVTDSDHHTRSVTFPDSTS